MVRNDTDVRPNLFFIVLSISAAIIVPSRLLTAGEYLYSWDSVNFALGMDELDIEQHQPHPPGYIGFVLAARAVRFLGPDSNLAMVLWNTLLAVLICCLVFAFAYALAPEKREQRAWIAWAIILPSPLLWFYTSVAEVYVSELFFTLVVAYCALRTLRGERPYMLALGGVLALAGAFKLTATVLMLPMAVYAVAKARAPHKWLAVGVFSCGLAIWLGPVVWSQGLVGYTELLWNQFAGSSARTSPFTSGSLETLNRNTRDTLYALVTGLGLVPFLAFLVLGFTRPWRSQMPSPVNRLLALWAVPYGLVFILVHFPKFGYVLPMLPIGCLVLTSLCSRLIGMRTVLALLVVHWLLSSLHFAVARPMGGALVGEGRRYRDKSAAQKTFTELNSLLRHGLHTIREADTNVRWVSEQIASSCPDEADVAIVTDSEMLNFRRSMYYFPKAQSLRPPSENLNANFATGRRQESDRRDLALTAPCRVFWILPPTHPIVASLSDDGALREITDGSHVMYWTAGPVTVATSAGPLEIRTDE